MTAICAECGALGSHFNCYHGYPHEGGVMLCRKHAKESDGITYWSIPLGLLKEDPANPAGLTWAVPKATGENA